MFGQRFRLKTATIATTVGPDQRIAVQLPSGTHFVVLDHIDPDAPLDSNHQVRVQCGGQVLSMFLVDIQEKSERIPPESKGRAVSDG
jgi:phosphatidylethanolamine-binding protein (PEBP) family uncharacterized protein